MSEERFDRIDQRLDALESGQHGLKAGLDDLRSGVTELRSGLTDLDHRMHVLHEHVISEVRAQRPEGPSRSEVKRWDDEVRENLGQRIDPLEAAVRQHSVEIERLNKARG